MFTLEQANKIVDRNFFLTWEGWTIKVIDPTKDGYTKPDGIYFNGKWSTFTLIEPNKEGLYALPIKYSRSIRTTKH